MKKSLIGNTFPLTLVEREIKITPISLKKAREIIKGREVVSFWGHENTAELASDVMGVEIPFRRVPLAVDDAGQLTESQRFGLPYDYEIREEES